MPPTIKPSIHLGIPGDPFTLFYDYDQVVNNKLDAFTFHEKITWFRERLFMTHIEPLRRIWKDQTVFEKLMHSKLDPNAKCSFSIAAMGIMLGIVEALGSFMDPATARSRVRDKNWKVFNKFLSQHMREWNVTVTVAGEAISVANVLWKSFRNGITHDLRVDRIRDRDLWGSLEFQQNFCDYTNKRFERHENLLRACPISFFDDLEQGVNQYFTTLLPCSAALIKFCDRFDEVYPSNLYES